MAQTQLADLLAKELGFKDKKDLKKRLESQSEDFAGGVKGRLAEGEGFRSAFAGSAKEQVEGFKQTFSKEGLKKFGRKTYRTTFAGDDMFSAYMRGRLRKKEKKELEEAGIEEGEGKGSPTKLGGDSLVFLKIIGKESMAIPAMARDTNVLRQNLQKLVKLWGGDAATKKEADESKEERKQDISYFAEQDKKEAELEGQRQTPAGKAVTPTPEKKEGGGGLLDSIMSMFADGFMSGIKKLFSPKMLGQILKKVFLPIAIIGTLFSGITDGFKKYQETGSFSEAIVAGLGGMLKFLTFGLFGEDTLKSMWEAVSGFLDPITETISGIFTGIKDFFKKIFGMGGEEDKGKDKIPKVSPQQPDPSKFAQDAAKAAGASDEKASDLGGLFGAVKSGDMKGLFGKAQEFAAKYPGETPAQSEGAPTPATGEGVPLDQAQRNYELNKRLTGEASKALGTPLPFNEPAPKAAAPTPAPIESVQKSPAPAPTSGEDPEISALENKIIDLETDIRNGKKMIERRKKHMSAPGARPEAIEAWEQANKASAQGVAENEAELEQVKKQLAEKKKAKGGAQASAAPAAATAGAAGGGGGGSVSAGGGGGGSVSSGGGGGGSTPSMDAGGGPSTSGSDVSSASSAVAEGQRMESAADMGSVINSPTTNNSSSSQGKAKPPTAEAYDSDLAKVLLRA